VDVVVNGSSSLSSPSKYFSSGILISRVHVFTLYNFLDPQRILSMTLGLIAFILSAVTASGCEFLSPSGDAETCYDHFGLFNFNNAIACTEAGGLYSGCSKYNKLMVGSPILVLK